MSALRVKVRLSHPASVSEEEIERRLECCEFKELLKLYGRLRPAALTEDTPLQDGAALVGPYDKVPRFHRADTARRRQEKMVRAIVEQNCREREAQERHHSAELRRMEDTIEALQRRLQQLSGGQ